MNFKGSQSFHLFFTREKGNAMFRDHKPALWWEVSTEAKVTETLGSQCVLRDSLKW